MKPLTLLSCSYLQGCLLLYMMPLMWSLSDHTLRWAGQSGEIKQSMVFMLYTSVVSTVVGLPWSLYSTFAVEQRHGFNKQVGWGLGWSEAAPCRTVCR